LKELLFTFGNIFENDAIGYAKNEFYFSNLFVLEVEILKYFLLKYRDQIVGVKLLNFRKHTLDDVTLFNKNVHIWEWTNKFLS